MAKNELQATIKGRYVGGAIWEPKDQEGRLRYNAVIILDDDEEAKINDIINKAKKDKWGDKPPAGLQIFGVRQGDDPEYAASFEKNFINPKKSPGKSNKGPVLMVRRNGVNETVNRDDDIFYAGCYVTVSVDAYGYDGDKAKNIKPGITLNLRGMLFRKDGERLGDFVSDDEFGNEDSEFGDDDDLI